MNSLQEKVHKTCGTFKLILGPMGSGKTTALERETRRLIRAHQVFIIIKWDKDQRYLEDYKDKSRVVTHDQKHLDGDVYSCAELSEMADIITKVNPRYILVDELHFFPDGAKTCWGWRLDGHNVIATGLNGTSELKPWKSISECLPLATHVEYLTSICDVCKSVDANTSYFSGNPTEKTRDVLVGGEGMYDARCATCFHKSTNGKFL
jgi:thymidine kinase